MSLMRSPQKNGYNNNNTQQDVHIMDATNNNNAIGNNTTSFLPCGWIEATTQEIRRLHIRETFLLWEVQDLQQ